MGIGGLGSVRPALQYISELKKGGGPVSCYPTSTTLGSAFEAPTFHLGVSFPLIVHSSIIGNKTLRIFHLSISLTIYKSIKSQRTRTPAVEYTKLRYVTRQSMLLYI